MPNPPEKTTTPLVASPEDLARQVQEDIRGASISPKDLDFLIAYLSTQDIRKAGEAVGWKYDWAANKKRELEPLINKIYPRIQAEAVKRLTLAAPKAADALSQLLDDLEDSKADTKRKTAKEILDRVVGKPVARVAVKSQAQQEVKIKFKDWSPPITNVPASDNKENSEDNEED